MLPGYADCPRRAAAKQFRKLFEGIGYQFRQLPPSVGSAAGTATHTGCEMLLRAKFAGKTISLDDALEPAIAGFSEEIAPGAIWDDTTPNANTAQLQIQRMVAAYRNGPLETIMPLNVNGEPAVELALEADAGDGWKLTGHIDVVDDFSVPHDTKTGSLPRPYYAQMGSYSLLIRSNRIAPVVEGLQIDYLQRVGKTKPQPPAEVKTYPVAPCERNAMAVIGKIKGDMAEFQIKQNPSAFPCNHMSMMCSDKYCPAWGTAFCELSGR